MFRSFDPQCSAVILQGVISVCVLIANALCTILALTVRKRFEKIRVRFDSDLSNPESSSPAPRSGQLRYSLHAAVNIFLASWNSGLFVAFSANSQKIKNNL